MECLKLVNVLKSTFLGSEFTKNAALTRDTQHFYATFIHDLKLKVAQLAS